MRDTQTRLEFRPLFVAIACALIAYGSAEAATLSSSGTYQLGSDAVQTLSSGPSCCSVDVISFPTSGANSAVLHSYGSASGDFGSRSSGYGTYDVTGAFSIVETYANTSSIAQRAIFNFYITPGMLQNEVNSTLSAGQGVSSGINFNILRNGTSVWGSSATLSTAYDATDPSSMHTSFTQSGVNLYTSSFGNPTYYAINGVTQSVDLGVINAGESIEVRYDLSTFANGNAPAGPDRMVPPQTFIVPEQWVDFCNGNNYGGCYGNGYGHLVPGEEVTIPGYTIPGAPSGSHASSGDPFSFSADSITPQFNGRADAPYGFSVSTSPVPEPDTYALMLAGLGALGLAARRHSRPRR